MTKLWLKIILTSWIVFTSHNRVEFEKKLNELPSYVMWHKETRVLTSGNIYYTLIYWDRNS